MGGGGNRVPSRSISLASEVVQVLRHELLRSGQGHRRLSVNVTLLVRGDMILRS